VPQLTVAVAPRADRVVVSLTGEADLSSRSELALRLTDAARAGDPVELDLAGVRFFDSSCIGTIGRFSRSQRSAGRHCRLVGVPPRTRRLIELVGLTDQLDVA
jgi:anti-anti-sigma factor